TADGIQISLVPVSVSSCSPSPCFFHVQLPHRRPADGRIGMPASQAGRRRFESGLPLHRVNHFHASPNQLLSHLSPLSAAGLRFKALNSNRSSAASRYGLSRTITAEDQMALDRGVTPRYIT